MRLGIKRSVTSAAPIWILGTLLAVFGLVAGIGALLDALSSDAAVALAAVIVTVASLLVAVLQWRSGLAEKALDALYQRIDLANRMRLEAVTVEVKPDDAQEEPRAHERKVAEEHRQLYRLFVFTEIDNLEYAVWRCRFGSGLNQNIVKRAEGHFRSRCQESKTFRDMATTCIDEGAYFPETKAAVMAILKDFGDSGPGFSP